jgi:membrane fusion protein (multidrug efflux system)
MKARTICLAGLALLILFSDCRTARDTASEAGPIKVVVHKVRSAEESLPFVYSGTIVESQTIPLSFSVTGTVVRVHVQEGQAVVKGQLLAEIDDATYRSAWEMTQAAEKRAEDAFHRLSRMYQNGNLPEVKYVEVESGLTQARAAAAVARKSLDDCRLSATVSGFVGKRSIEPGMTALPNVTSITLVRIDKVFARVPIPENDIALVHKGDRATIRIGALGDEARSGTVEDVGVEADPLAHTYRVRIAVPNSDGTIKPGMVCTALLRTPGQSRRLIVPTEAVLVDETGRNYVYTLDPSRGKALWTPVKIGALFADGIEIQEGLAAGAEVVVSGQHRLTDQAAVTVVPDQAR